ncbi:MULTISPECIES: hypothetical protein [unclassified Rhizobium]|uniref:hypothetical protein n=1 Tax=unclassified Rhizobium TaxID=2613769 RepID=UPI0028898F8A|nr:MULTISPECIES: hypothetical protein [unclassified Rhizobium]
MSRTYDANHILAALIEEYQREEHFIFNEGGKVFARLITGDHDGAQPSASKIDFCLTDMALNIAERLSL